MSEQLALFDNEVEISITIDEAAELAKVSSATIRNWIKTNYLHQIGKGLVSKTSFDDFLQNVAGSEKLNSRANKSQKDSHNHVVLVEDLLSEIKHGVCNLDNIGNRYEESLSNSYRNMEGIYYTPKEIVEDLLKDYKEVDKSNLTFCDPSCGSGNFIMGALEIGFSPENIYGFDIDPVAVEITKERIRGKTGFIGNNIVNKDFLKHITDVTCKYDFIFTNPPWGKKLDKKDKDYYGRIFNAGNSIDTSALFFFASMKCLNDNGVIGFLLPESFFNISVFENARKKALQYNILRFRDYGKSFEGLVTKAQAFVLKNLKIPNDKVLCETEETNFYRKQSTFKNNPKSIFNFYSSNSDSEIIDHIFSIDHLSLKDNAKWGLGIVTGNNAKFCISELKSGYIPVYKGSDITKNGLKEPTTFIPKDTTLYQQVAPIEYYEANEKLIYKFISSKLCFYCDNEQRYILNSANMVIVNESFPISGSQVSKLLSSEFMNWIFSQIFNTHKVLRGDIESLPIHHGYFSKYEIFTEENYLEYLNLTRSESGTYRIKR